MSGDSDARVIEAGAELLREAALYLDKAAAALGPDFAAVARALAERRSFTIVLGVGKSGYIGRKFAASLISTGHGAAFLHPAEAVHGDLGIAKHSTLAVLLSHSGNAEELVALAPALPQFKIRVALVTKQRKCQLARYADWVIETGVEEEAGVHGLAPTTSSTTTLAICDALMMASLSLRGFSPEEFDRYHPGGPFLGRRLRKISDLMIPLDDIAWLSPSASVYEVLEQVSLGRRGFGVVSERPWGERTKADSVGVISDGDIRRAAHDHERFGEKTAASIMSRSPKSISRDALAIDALRLMESYRITFLLCTDAEGYLVGAVDIHDVVSPEVGVKPGLIEKERAVKVRQ